MPFKETKKFTGFFFLMLPPKYPNNLHLCLQRQTEQKQFPSRGGGLHWDFLAKIGAKCYSSLPLLGKCWYSPADLVLSITHTHTRAALKSLWCFKRLMHKNWKKSRNTVFVLSSARPEPRGALQRAEIDGGRGTHCPQELSFSHYADN